MRFDLATALEPTGPGRYAADLDSVWGVLGNPNGGYLMAVLAKAALAHTRTPAPLAVSAAFLRPATHGQAQIEVSTLKAGRTATHATATLYQADSAVVSASFVLGAPVGPAIERFPLELPPESQCLPSPPISDRPNLLHRMQVSYAPGFGPGEDGPPEVRGWVRLLSDEEPDALVALLAADALAPAVFRAGYRSWAPTVQMTVQLHRAPAPGPLAVQVVAGELRDGWFDEEATVVDSTGALVARGRQLARLPQQGR